VAGSFDSVLRGTRQQRLRRSTSSQQRRCMQGAMSKAQQYKVNNVVVRCSQKRTDVLARRRSAQTPRKRSTWGNIEAAVFQQMAQQADAVQVTPARRCQTQTARQHVKLSRVSESSEKRWRGRNCTRRQCAASSRASRTARRQETVGVRSNVLRGQEVQCKRAFTRATRVAGSR